MSMPDDLQAIDAQRDRWIAAVNGRDVEAYSALLTADVVWIPPGQPAISGRRAFEAWVRPFFAGFHYDFVIRDAEAQVAGGWAVERGAFQTTMVSIADEQKGEHGGRYLVLWRREPDHVWRIERYLDETSLEAATG